jgi:hypothetical protein
LGLAKPAGVSKAGVSKRGTFDDRGPATLDVG